MRKKVSLFTLIISICACLINFSILAILLINHNLIEIDSIVVLSMFFSPFVIIKLNYDIYFKYFKYSLLNTSNEIKVKVYKRFVLLIIFFNLLSLYLTFILHI